jgi:hypothetical protein
MASTTTTPITCPAMCCAGKCGGETVEASGFGSPKATQIRVAPCSFLVAQGWRGPQLVEYKSRADYLLPAATTTVVRHRDGLVTLG